MKRVLIIIAAAMALIFGSLLAAPAQSAPVQAGHYTVEQGDTYSIIAGKLGVTASALACANRTSNTSCPSVTSSPGVGRIIHVPPVTVTTTTTTAATTTTTTPATTTTAAPTTTTTTPATTTTTTVPVTTTTVPSGAQQPIPSNFDVNAWLNGTPFNPLSSGDGTGNFRTQCEFSHLAFDDPIVYPGQPHAAHLHQFFGNTAVDAFSTYSSLRTTGNGTCQGGPVNRTGYWTPTLMNGAGQVVVPDLLTVYYKAEYNPPATIVSFPPGFRYIAGYNAAAPTAETHLNWYCATVQVKRQTIPSCPVGDQILANIEFPQCWNGVDVDSANHRSHTAYISYVNGVPTCPAGYPKHLPELTEIVIWNATAEDESTWSISSDAMMGKTHGESFHADWFGAWDTPIQEVWTQKCVREARNCIDGQLGDGRTLRQVVQYTGPSVLPPPA